MVRLGEKPVFSLGEYRQLAYHEAELKGRIGIRHDLSDEDGPIWLSIDRLKRIAPPTVPEEIQPWLTVAADPAEEPVIETVRTETISNDRANQLIEDGILQKEDIQPAMRPDRFGDEEEQAGLRDVIFRLQNLPDIERAIRAYVEGPWREWAEAEKPRRETIRIYDDFFSLQQAIQATDGEQGLELVWGLGIVRWRLEDGRVIDHPVVEQLVEIDIDTLTGRINLRPRSTEPSVPLKPFFAIENQGADHVHSFARNFFTNFPEDQDLSPFNGETFEPILREVATRMHGEARYHPDDLSDITDRTLPQIDNTLRVTNTWVVFGRRRDDNLFINDLEKLKEAVAETEELPGPARRLVTEPSSAPPHISPIIDVGPGSPSIVCSGDVAGSTISVSGIETTQTEEFFFPKPFNEDQISIIRRLNEADGIVVQGPPGTGKTHTIANIICHYLATGRRVLVTSKGEGALTVLRDHIPEGIQDLTITLLTNERAGFKQLEQAVTVLANTATQANPHHLERDIQSGQEHIPSLRKKIANIDRQLDEWASRHLKKIGDGEGILPMELARMIVGDRKKHVWLPDSPGPEARHDPRFTDEDIADLREARKALRENLQYLDKELPSLADLPDAATITAIHEDLVNAKKLEDSAADRNTPVLSLSVERAIERAEQLLEAVKSIAAVFRGLEKEPWLFSIFETWRDKGMDSDEVRLFNMVLPAVGDIAERRQLVVSHAVTLPEGADKDDRLMEAVSRAAAGSRPFRMVAIGKSEARALYRQIRIEGREPRSAEEWGKVAETIHWRRDLVALASRWKAISGEYGLPPLHDDVDRAGRWLTAVNSLIGRVAKILNEDYILIKTELPRLFPYGMSAADILGSREAAEGAVETINVNLSKKRLSGSRDKLDDRMTRLAACSGPIVDVMTRFVANSVGNSALTPLQISNRWQELCQKLSDIIMLRPQMETVKRVARVIAESGAPNWADALRTDPVAGADDPWTPGGWRDTWNWRRQETYLRQIDGRDTIRKLSEERLQYEDDLRKTFHKVVEHRTFLSLKKSMTEQVESALVMFTSAIRRIGKGTGIRAQRFRRDARVAMEKSYAAVPCWIMPAWRISESLPADLGSFDLVIVDEASQSDIGALPALVRGKKVLIVGDDKQVSPTAAFVEERRVLQLKHNFLQGQPFAPLVLPGGSLYDLANAMFPGRRIMLHEHFRCVEPIIRFSMQFYTEPLIPLRIPKASERLDPPLVDVYIPHGRKDRHQVNVAEAEAIVDEIERIVADPAFEGRTIGVVSLIGNKQAHYIQSRLLSRIGEEAYIAHNITCGNSATFQGKERDIMLVSMVECPLTESAKTALLWEQRFNVAFSRARDRMYLFRSVDEDCLRPDDLKAKAIRHFKSPMESAVPEVDDLIKLCESGFERDVFRRLRDQGYRVTPQVRVARYSIDMVVEGDQGRRLAIELDGDQYHTPEQWADDLVRMRTMERMGWQFWRCWGSSFYLDPEDCMADLIRTLDSLGIKPLGGEAPRHVYTEHRVLREPAADTAEPEEHAEPVEPSEPKMADVISMPPPSVATPILAPSQPQIPTEEENTVEIGDRVLVTYNDEAGRQHTIRISDTEHDPDMRIIRADYPLAQALLGATVDEELEIPAGGSTRTITVLAIEKDSSKLQLQASATRTPLVRSPIGEVKSVFGGKSLSAEREAVAPSASEPARVSPETAERPQQTPDFTGEDQAGTVEEHFAANDEVHKPSLQAAPTYSRQPYQVWNQHPLPDPRNEPPHKIADRLIEIIEVEGPVVLHRVFHLYADACGIKRIGNQLRSIFLRATAVALRSGRIDAENSGNGNNLGLETVVRIAGSPPVVLRKRGPRTFEEIPPSEIAAAMQSLMNTHGRDNEENLYRRTLDYYDLKRLTTNVRDVFARILSELR